jgi:hypothetical protein
MTKYPFLQSIRFILVIVGWVIIVVAVLGGLGLGSINRRFDVLFFLGTVAAGFASGAPLIVLAELIGVFLNMEGHLARMTTLVEQLTSTMASRSFSSAPHAEPASPLPRRATTQGQRATFDEAQHPLPAPVDGPQLPARVIIERTMLKDAPNRRVVTVAMPQHAIIVVKKAALT